MYRPVFTRQPESWREWWSAVRAFAAAWYGIAAGEVTGKDPGVLTLEREIGLTISPSVHEWAAFAADLQRAGIFQRAIRDDFTLGWDPVRDALRLLTLGEGDVEWVVVREHLADEDPPVEGLHLDGSDGRVLGTWQHTPTTSEFVLQQLIAYLDHPGGGFSVDVTMALISSRCGETMAKISPMANVALIGDRLRRAAAPVPSNEVPSKMPQLSSRRNSRPSKSVAVKPSTTPSASEMNTRPSTEKPGNACAVSFRGPV